MASLPPPEGSDVFLSDGIAWDALRDSGIPATVVSDLDETWENRREFQVGARLVGVGSRRMPTLLPQNLLVADYLSSNRRSLSLLEPRRSSKTTSIFAWALGRCSEREEFMVGYTACTTGQKARERFRKDIAAPIERLYPDKDNRPMKVYHSSGSERLEFPNGSVFSVHPPHGDAFRSDAFDVVIFDEAGEATPEMGEDLRAGASSTMDTRLDAQLIVAGTAAKYRQENLLWDYLERGKAGKSGILAFNAADETTVDELEDWDRVAELLKEVHPGVGNLTNLDIIRERWETLKPVQFAAEYLGIFGTVGAKPGIMDYDRWERGKIAGAKPQPPEKFALAVAVHPDQIAASIVAVWREDGRPRIVVLAHDRGVRWLADKAAELAIKYATPIVHDTNPTMMVEVEQMARKRPKPRLLPQTFGNVQTAAGLLVKEVNTGNVGHWGQDVMNTAVAAAQKRVAGRNGWALGRGNPEDDITPVEAASLALRVYDQTPERQKLPSSFAV